MIEWVLARLGKGHSDDPEVTRRRRHRSDVIRDGVLFLVAGLMVLALVNSQDAVTRSGNALRAQAEGRRLGSIVTCASISAVIDAGRATIVGGQAIGPPRFERSLEALGLPPPETRAKQAEKAAGLYAQSIATKVEAASGLGGIVRENGTLNCPLIRKLTALK